MKIIEDNTVEGTGCRDLVVLLANGTVEAEVEIYDRSNGHDGFCIIYMWNSTKPGKGNTNKALADLRAAGCTYLAVSGIGMDDSYGSWQYWVHQWGAKRVDLLWDDEGVEILKRER